MRLSDELAQVKDEQSYIIVRERTHRNTAESTNSRVKWWSLFQLAVLIANGIFQVWWLKRFFEVPCPFPRIYLDIPELIHSYIYRLRESFNSYPVFLSAYYGMSNAMGLFYVE